MNSTNLNMMCKFPSLFEFQHYLTTMHSLILNLVHIVHISEKENNQVNTCLPLSGIITHDRN